VTRLLEPLRPRGLAPWLVPSALVAFGAALRLWQYWAGASLWADEANLALNVIDRPLGQLLGPLDYRQVAPPGWLVLVKGAVSLFGEGEQALRLVPFLGSLVALPLFWHVARQALPAGLGAPLALGLFAAGFPFIFYAAQVKPYSTDVAAALLLTALTLRARVDSRRSLLRGVGLAGAIAPWLSYPALLMNAGLLAALAASALVERERARLRALAPVALAWLASGTGVVLWARSTLTPDDVLYMQRFWDQGFLPLPPASLKELAWPVVKLSSVYGGGGLRYPAPGIFLILAGVGAWGLWRAARDRAWLLLGPILATFGAAALRAYPFAPRITLFLVPSLLVLTAAGPDALGRLAGTRRQRVAALVATACATLALVGLGRSPLPYTPEPLEPVIRAMRQVWQPGDRAYVYYGGEKAFIYYARRYGFASGDYVLGDCARDDGRAYLRELDAFRGAPRLWLVVTHEVPAEATALRGYLDRIGTRRTSFEAGADQGLRRSDRARVDLYDLSDPARLSADSAETFPLPPAVEGVPGAAWSCHPNALATEDDAPPS
jgi:hypothetical protein